LLLFSIDFFGLFVLDQVNFVLISVSVKAID